VDTFFEVWKVQRDGSFAAAITATTANRGFRQSSHLRPESRLLCCLPFRGGLSETVIPIAAGAGAATLHLSSAPSCAITL
jgi:hypothetical protein